MKLSFEVEGDLDAGRRKLLGEYLTLGAEDLGLQIGDLREDGPIIKDEWFELPEPGSQRQRVLIEVLTSGSRGMTRDDLCRVMGLDVSSINPRVYELVIGEFIYASNEERMTRQGGMAEVLKATDKAKTKTNLKPKAWWL
jgi:hypothetical protein